jgi:hypothetical protein
MWIGGRASARCVPRGCSRRTGHNSIVDHRKGGLFTLNYGVLQRSLKREQPSDILNINLFLSPARLVPTPSWPKQVMTEKSVSGGRVAGCDSSRLATSRVCPRAESAIWN